MEFGDNQDVQNLWDKANDDYDDYVVFGNSRSTLPSVRHRRASTATTSSAQTPKMSVLSVGEDENDVEEVPRVRFEQTRTSSSRTGRGMSGLQIEDADETQVQVPQIASDVTLFIKMSLHPTTLSAFLSPEGSILGSPH
jgi:hypothetical protein